jgi:hypothetical protein
VCLKSDRRGLGLFSVVTNDMHSFRGVLKCWLQVVGLPTHFHSGINGCNYADISYATPGLISPFQGSPTPSVVCRGGLYFFG